MSNATRPPTNVSEAIELLDDAEFIEWCLVIANKNFIALLSKKWPEFARKRNSERRN